MTRRSGLHVDAGYYEWVQDGGVIAAYGPNPYGLMGQDWTRGWRFGPDGGQIATTAAPSEPSVRRWFLATPCPGCQHEIGRHDPEDGACDAHATEGLGVCQCGREAAPAPTRDEDEAAVIAVCEVYGYGRTMQIASNAWRDHEIRARVEALERANEPHIQTGADDRWTGVDDIREDDAIEADFTDHTPDDLRWLLDERDRLLADVERLATEMEAFQPGGEMGPLFAAGQAHAYRDAARHLRELRAGEGK